jgi:hypothetical protein
VAKHVVLFHSALGLRDVEHGAARLLRADGHEVHVADLYGGRVATDLDSGLRLMHEVGWDTICNRVRIAVQDLPDDTIRLGISMGAGVPPTVSPHTRVELHAGSNDSLVELAQRTRAVAGLASPDYDRGAAELLWTRVRAVVR